MAEGNYEQVRLWNLPSGALQQTLRGYVNDDGNVVAIKAKKQEIWLNKEVQHRERSRCAVGDGANCTTVRLAFGIITFQIITFQRGDWSHTLNTREVEPERLIDFALSPDGKTLATSHTFGAKGVHLWDVETGKHIRTIGAGDDPLALAFSQDGNTLAIGTAYDKDVALVSVKQVTSSALYASCPANIQSNAALF